MGDKKPQITMMGERSKDGFYTSKQWDEDIELYYFNARWYDPETGRFITEDPIRDGTGWYSYVGNNPMGFVDPTGLMSKDGVSKGPNPGAGFGSGESHTSPDKESRPDGGGPKNIGWSYGEKGWSQLKGGIVTYDMLWSDAGIILNNNRNNRKGNYSSLPNKPGNMNDAETETEGEIFGTIGGSGPPTMNETITIGVMEPNPSNKFWSSIDDSLSRGAGWLFGLGPDDYVKTMRGRSIPMSEYGVWSNQQKGMHGGFTALMLFLAEYSILLESAGFPSAFQINGQIANELQKGGSWLMTEEQYFAYVKGQPIVGRPDGQFITSASQMNKLISRTGGDPIALGNALGVEGWTANTKLYRIDMLNPLSSSPRCPTAHMSGANTLYRSGGATIGGVPEIVVEPTSAINIWGTPIK